MKPAPILLAVAVTTAVAFPQFKTRPNTRLSTNFVPVNTYGSPAWQIAAPKQPVVGSSSAGTVHTARLVHLAYLDVAGGNPIYAYFRSTSGGYSWENRRTLFTIGSGEGSRADDMRVLAWKNSVYVVFSSTRNNPTGDHSTLVLGSNDQGQTWQGPLLLSTGVNAPSNPLKDTDGVQAALANDVLHVAFLADSTGSVMEDVYYTSAGFVNGTLSILTPETRINTANAMGTVDCDLIAIASDGGVVNVAWQDDRIAPGNGSANNTFSKTSTQQGTDFATVNEVNHSNFTAPIVGTIRTTQNAVAGPNVYVLLRDQRVLLDFDDVYLSISNDVGRTWNLAQINPQNGADTDMSALSASGSDVYVAYTDNRTGTNHAFLGVDRNSGQGFRAGNQTEHQLSTNDTPALGNIDLFGEVVAVAFEQCAPGDASIGYSVDGGNNFVSIRLTNGGGCTRSNRDVDAPSLVVTQYRDIATVWASEPFAGGENSNRVFAGGTKVPVLQNLTAQNQGLALVEGSPSDGNDLALVLMSATGTGFSVLEAPIGFGMNLAFDGLTLAVVGNITPFLAQITPQGTAIFPTLPDVGALLGVNVWAAALTYDLTAGRFTVQTDPFKF